MLDVIGVLQHHDAITGTGRQHVADNYSEKVSSGISTNNEQYVKLIANSAQEAGVHNGQWQWCSRSNSTYVDCPINDQPDDASFVLAVHNPAMINDMLVKIPVKHGHYRVQSFNRQSKSYHDLDHVSVHCVTEREENQPDKTVENCWLFAKDFVEPNSISFYKFNYDESTDLTMRPYEVSSGHQITNFYQNLEYLGEDNERGVHFNLIDLLDSTQRSFYFDLKYWMGQQDTDYQPSGVYLFRPAFNQTESLRYSKLQKVEVIECSVKSEYILHYSICDDCSESSLMSDNYQQAIVYVSLLSQFDVIDV